MHLSNTLPHNNRIEIADVLRGFAVMGITLIHFIERFSLNSFPEETCNFLIFTDRIIWDSVFFTFSGKAYCIFALLFGFSFFIKTIHKNLKGKIFVGGLPGGQYYFFLQLVLIRLYFRVKYGTLRLAWLCTDRSLPTLYPNSHDHSSHSSTSTY